MGAATEELGAGEEQAARSFLKTVVQHHQSRAELLLSLRAALDDLDPEVVTDTEQGRRWNLWQVYHRCLQAAHTEDCSHALIIQDDAVPCRHFAEAVREVIAARQQDVICLYVGGGSIGQGVLAAARACKPWSPLPRNLWLPLVATIYPMAVVEEILTWAKTDEYAQRARSDDGVVGRFLRQSRHRAWATVPSLVQHPDNVPSLVRRTFAAGRDSHRVAACYIGGYDPLEIDW